MPSLSFSPWGEKKQIKPGLPRLASELILLCKAMGLEECVLKQGIAQQPSFELHFSFENTKDSLLAGRLAFLKL